MYVDSSDSITIVSKFESDFEKFNTVVRRFACILIDWMEAQMNAIYLRNRRSLEARTER